MKRIFIVGVALAVLLLLTTFASAATYYVSTSGNDNNAGTLAQPFRTIQRCANLAVAGDTCIVRAGSYNEVVNVVSSGVANNLIEFQASGNAIVAGFSISGRHYIRIEGFEITDLSVSGPYGVGVYIYGSNGTEIIANRIHHTRGLGIWLTGGANSNNNIIIRSNNISFPGAIPDLIGDGAINLRGNNILVENNDISHVGDFTNAWGYYNVIRNNYFHDCYMSDFPGNPMTEGHHIDGMQYYSTADTIPFHFLLFENNSFDNIVMSNGHAAILRNVGGRDDSDAIFRYNNMYHAGESAIGMSPFNGVRIYNNHIVNVANDPRIADIPGYYTYAQRSRNTIVGYNFGAGITQNIKIINNLFYNSTRQDSISGSYYIDPASTAGFYADYNLAYLSGSYGFNEPHGILGVNPNLRNYPGSDFSLAEGSVAIDAGGPLTTVASTDSGSGTTLRVADARYFQDGWAGVEPDWVAVGSANNAAQIESINYDANVITLAGAISRSVGDPVWLYKDSNGRRVLYGDAPDIGAFEYASGSSPPPEPVAGDFDGNGRVTIVDLSAVGRYWGFNSTNPGWNSTVDVFVDGVIDIRDLVFVSRRWTG